MYTLDKPGPRSPSAITRRLPCSGVIRRRAAAATSIRSAVSAVSEEGPQGRGAAGRAHRAGHHRRPDRDRADRVQPGRHGHRVRAVQRRDDGRRAGLPVAGPVGAGTAAAAGARLPVGCIGRRRHRVDTAARRRGRDQPRRDGIGQPGHHRARRTADRRGGQGAVSAAHDDRPAPQRAQLADRLPGVRGPGRRRVSPGWRTSSTSAAARRSATRC